MLYLLVNTLIPIRIEQYNETFNLTIFLVLNFAFYVDLKLNMLSLLAAVIIYFYWIDVKLFYIKVDEALFFKAVLRILSS